MSKLSLRVKIGRGIAALGGIVVALLLSACADTAMPPVAAKAAPQLAVWFGATLVTVELPPTSASAGLSSGGRVDVVYAGSPAEAAGLRAGDVILTVDQKPVAADGEFFSAARGLFQILTPASPGAVVPVSLIRDGQRQSLSVTLAPRPPTLDGHNHDELVARIKAEQQAALGADKAGDRRHAFDHYVKALRLPMLEAWYYPDNVGLIFSDNVEHVGEILGALQPQPAIPGDAARHNRRAVALLKSAAGDADNDRASNEFGYAIYEAPWVADLYLDLGLVEAQAGTPESATLDFRRYLLLNPKARDSTEIEQKITDLELQAEERKPWLRFVNLWQMENGGAERVTLRGRKLVLAVDKPTPKTAEQPGDIVCSGTIHDRDFHGTCNFWPTTPEAIACLGAKRAYDADGRIEDDNTLVLRAVNDIQYREQSCAIISETRGAFRTIRAAH
jgi:hypothetical protein